MTINHTLGKFEFITDEHDGDKVEVRHSETGDSFLIRSDGGAVPMAFATGDLPSSPDDDGTMYHDADRGIPSWWDRDHYEWPSFVDDVLTSPVTVSNSTTRTTVWDPGINTGSLIKGRTYQVDLMGKFSTTNNSDTFTVDVDLGGTDVAGISNTPANATDVPWSIEFTFSVREHGTNGKLIAHTRGLFNSNPDDTDSDEISVDTTTATELTFDIQWSAADPGNSVTLEQAHLKQMA